MRKWEKQGEGVRIVITSAVPPRAEVVVFDAAGVVLKADALNLASEKARTAFCDKLDAPYNIIVDTLLVEALVELQNAPVASTAPLATQQAGAPTPDEPEPWPEPVDGAAMLDEVRSAIRRHVVLSPDAAAAVSLWITHTHVLDAAEHSPILGIVSPDKRCGKTTLLNIIEQLAYKAAPITHLTTANLFRTIADGYVTLSLDEADMYLDPRRNAELIALLNRGHTKNNAFTIRRDKTDQGLVGTWFPLWAAKAIAAIGTTWHTLADRSIRISMRRAGEHEKHERIRPADRQRYQALHRKLRRWAIDNIDALRLLDPATPVELNSREEDNWRILTAIADIAGGDWPVVARKAAIELQTHEADIASPSIELLTDLRDVLREYGSPYIATEQLLEVLCSYDEFWKRYDYGRPITAKALAALLQPYEIRPVRRRINHVPFRGYNVASFQDAFDAYLPPDDPAHAEHPEHPSDVPPEPGEPGNGHAPTNGNGGVE